MKLKKKLKTNSSMKIHFIKNTNIERGQMFCYINPKDLQELKESGSSIPKDEFKKQKVKN